MPTKKKKSAAAKKKPAAKAKPRKTVSKKRPPAKPAVIPAKKVKPVAIPTAASAARDALRTRILGAKKKPAKPIAFSLDEVRAIAKTVSAKEAKANAAKAAAKPALAKKADLHARPARTTPNHVKPASLADVLGFNPRKARSAEAAVEKEVPEKYKRYYRLLVDLRRHLSAGIELHSEETLKRSAKEDSGDLSSYGQHMADAGTDTFDRDFALSLVSSEQEALTEIDSAIQRIHDGTYGICENTQKPIAKERLLAVPFTRYSAGAQKELERNRHRSRTQAGLFGELGEEGAKHESDSGSSGTDE